MKTKNSIRSCPAAIALAFGLLCPSSLYAFTEIYNTEGTFEWVCPPGVTSITVECWGGGGAGGGAYRYELAAGTNHAGGGGGGGGAYARTEAVPVTPGLTYTVTIPPAATNPLPIVDGTTVDGADVSFTGDSSVIVTAAGGKGGISVATSANVAVAGDGGLGGAVSDSIGDVVFAGGEGARQPASGAGAGGGGAGDSEAGVSAVDGNTLGALGGLQGGGNGGNGKTGQGAGTPGANAGGGGGGGRSQTVAVGYAGGTGGLGQIRLSDGVAFSSVKQDNSEDLSLPASWTDGVPGPADVAVWDSTVTAANTTLLGADLTWAGIAIQNPGGLVTIDAGDPINTLTLGLAETDIDLSAATADLILNCNLALNAANVWDVQTERTLTLAGVISGAGSISKQGDGTAILSGANTFNAGTAGITIAAGTLQLGASEVIPQGAGRGNVFVNGTLDLNGFSETFNGLDGSGIVDTTAADGESTLTIGIGVSNSNFTGIIQNTAGTLNLIKSQSGTAQLSNANTFSGTATVDGGTLQLNNPLALQNVSGITIGGSTLSITPDGTNLTAPITLDSGGLIACPTADATATLSGPIDGIGNLTKDGAGTLIVSGELTYSGDTIVNGGTLSLEGANLANDTASVSVANSALLELNFTGSDLVGTLITDGTVQPDGIYGHTDSGADNGGQGVGVLDFYFAPASGTLTVTSSGYQSWAAGFAGLTDIDPSLDFDQGGLDTGIEYVVGGDPTDGSDDLSLAPTSSLVGTDLVFEFRRTTQANNDPNATIAVQYGSDLEGWIDAEDGVNGVNITENTGFYGAADQVVVTLPATLAVDGKIFARLSVAIMTP